MPRILLLATCVFSFLLLSCGDGSGGEDGQVVLRFNIDPIGKAMELNEQFVEEYEALTGVKVELIKGPTSATERLSLYLQYLGAKSADIDLYQIDVIWPGILANHMVDLKPSFGEGELEDFFPALIENTTVDGRLISIPWFGDAGILYYRTDLLEKYGYDAPPRTWDELESMASHIQGQERQTGNPDFWGYVWQGMAYEGLTCNTIEWVSSHGGGMFVDEEGKVTVNNDRALAAISRAKEWVGTLSPPGVTTSELQSHAPSSYAVFCLKEKKKESWCLQVLGTSARGDCLREMDYVAPSAAHPRRGGDLIAHPAVSLRRRRIESENSVYRVDGGRFC